MSEADRWLSRSPGFFGGKPVVMDVSALPAEKAVITALMDDLATQADPHHGDPRRRRIACRA